MTSKDTKIIAKAHRLVAKETGQKSRAQSGLASSLAFTPVQGLELANPVAQQLPTKDEGYFSTSGFAFVKKQSK